MDPNFNGFSDYTNGFRLEDDIILPYSDQNPSLKFNIPSPDFSFIDRSFSSTQIETSSVTRSLMVSPSSDYLSASTGWSPEGESSSPSDDSESSDPVLKYISQMLLEENMEDIPHMFNDSFALHDTERSLYEVLGEIHSPEVSQPQHVVSLNKESPESNFSSGYDHGSATSSTLSGSSGFVNQQWTNDVVAYETPHLFQAPQPIEHPLRDLQEASLQVPANSMSDLNNVGNGLIKPSVSELLLQNMLSNEESMLQFKKGFEEGSKFLPSNNRLIIDLKSGTLDAEKKEEDSQIVVKVENNEWDHSLDVSRGRRHHEREDTDIQEERRSKQSATYVDESELSEMFDKVLLCVNTEALKGCLKKPMDENGESQNPSGTKTRGRKQNRNKEMVDLRSLLVLSAQAVSINDRRTATELLKQIKEHSSPSGDGCQRLAHFFANALEARLDGRGSGIQNFFASPDSQKTTVADILKAYKSYLATCPFKKLAIAFANKTICKMATKATTLHIVDFGIMYGFQWPILIQHLSTRAGGPPRLRITGIDIPLPGFRPLGRIEETGRRLARYCERFKVPFEYNAIAAKNWESIKIEDLKIDSSEMLAVNCLYHFKNLLDETAEEEGPRDAVLKLIRKMNPRIFVHAVINGSYNAPFFVTRFREALFYFSALFDMFDATMHREEPGRLMYEKEFYGRAVMNVVACEGVGRYERPETYKQWQVRTVRAGFKQMPLDQELVEILKGKLKAWYHKDFVMDEDNHWLLQGWKGRILCASSCWVPA